jgi:hypothetical protein
VSPINHQTLQLVMDYITDAIVSTAVLSGRPYVSPDSRHVVTVDDLTGKVSVAGVNNEGNLIFYFPLQYYLLLTEHYPVHALPFYG